jgi:predicted aspartyl protease
MKKLLNLILLTATFNSVAVVAQAQNNDTCFMLDAKGNSVNLGSLCQNSSSKYDHSQKQKPQEYQNNTNVHTIPIKSRRNGIPVIDVKFNNNHVFEMMLDTGASQIVITQQMAKTLNVSHFQDVWVSTPSNSLVAMSSGYLYSVGVANLSQQNPLVITSPTMDIGLLGQSFFSHYDLTIKSDVIEFRER